MTEVRAATRSTGTVVGPMRAALLVVEGRWEWYRRNWRATFIASIVQPAMFLAAMGLGLGSQVRPGAVTGGVSYLAYLAPALLAASAVQNAVGESTYPVLSSFKWQQVYVGITATPVTPRQIYNGQLLWIAARVFVTSVAFVLISVAFGAVQSPAILLSLLSSALAGTAVSAVVIAYTATIMDEGQQFNFLQRFVVMPMTLFAGTFYPVSQLPAWVRPLAWITPLWHGTELSRGFALGTLEFGWALVHIGYLLALLVAGILWGRGNYQRRLAL